MSNNGQHPDEAPEPVEDYFPGVEFVCPEPYNLLPEEELVMPGHPAMVVNIQGGPHNGARVFVPTLEGDRLVIEEQRDPGSFPWTANTRIALRAEHTYRTEPCPTGDDHEHIVEIIFDTSSFLTMGEAIERNIVTLRRQVEEKAAYIEKCEHGLGALRTTGVESMEDAEELGLA